MARMRRAFQPEFFLLVAKDEYIEPDKPLMEKLPMALPWKQEAPSRERRRRRVSMGGQWPRVAEW
jgi:hypothetical protein